MDIKKYLENIGNLVGKDDLPEAINLLQKLLKNSPKLDEAILQSSRLTDVMRQIRNGTISLADADMTKNKIRLAILSLAGEIEETVLSQKHLQEEFEQKREDGYPIIINQQIHNGNGDNIGGDKIVIS